MHCDPTQALSNLGCNLQLSRLFFQDESHRLDRSASWLSLLLGTALPKARGCSSHSNPTWSLPQPRGAQGLLPWRHLYFRKSGSRLTVRTVKGELSEKAPHLPHIHKESVVQCVHPCDGEGSATVLQASWYFGGLGSGKTSEKFRIKILQKEFAVPFQNRTTPAIEWACGRKNKSENHFCSRQHSLQFLLEI